MFLIVSSITKSISYRHHNFDKFYYKMIKRLFPQTRVKPKTQAAASVTISQNVRASPTQNSRLSPNCNPPLKNSTFRIHSQIKEVRKGKVSHTRRPSHMTYTPRNMRTSKCDVHNKPLQLEALLAITHRFSKKKQEKQPQLSDN